MSWTLSATGRTAAGLEHLEKELHDALHKVLADPRFGLLFSHFQGETVDQLHTVGEAPAAEPETPAVPAAAATEVAPAKDDKAAAKATGG